MLMCKKRTTRSFTVHCLLLWAANVKVDQKAKSEEEKEAMWKKSMQTISGLFKNMYKARDMLDIEVLAFFQEI